MKYYFDQYWYNLDMYNEKRFELFSISLVLYCELNITIFNFSFTFVFENLESKGIEKIKDAFIRARMRLWKNN